MPKVVGEEIDSGKQLPTPPPVEDEETDEELVRPRTMPINRRKNAMDGDGDHIFSGINKAPSVFQKGTLFDTTQK